MFQTPAEVPAGLGRGLVPFLVFALGPFLFIGFLLLVLAIDHWS